MSSYTYPCFVVNQRDPQAGAPTFCLLSAPVGTILEWAAIARIEEQKGYVQRAMNQAKIRGIKRFLTSDARNTVATAVVVTLKVGKEALRSVACEEGQQLHLLSFTVPEGTQDRDKPGLVVDGQHRLLGMRDADPGLPIPVVLLLNPDPLETAFQFLVINNKASKVSTDHIRALALEYKEEGLEERLHTARLSLSRHYDLVGLVDTEQESPFKGMIDWPANRKGSRIVLPAAIEAALRYIQDQDLKMLKEEDALLEFFYAIWGAVRARWPALWGEGSRLLEKVGVVCLNQYLADSLFKMYEWGIWTFRAPSRSPERPTCCSGISFLPSGLPPGRQRVTTPESGGSWWWKI
jgi:DGQHR domain-containing protein